MKLKASHVFFPANKNLVQTRFNAKILSELSNRRKKSVVKTHSFLESTCQLYFRKGEF